MKIELKQPTEPGVNAGDMFCGHPDDPATVTHGWCGTQWHQTISDEWAAAVRYRAEAELLKTCGVTELMLHNPNVSAYVAEAEAKVASLTAERDAALAGAVTVKPLEWRNGVARTRWGIYRIMDLGEDWGSSGRFDVSFNNRDVGAADTQLDAERIVINHYEVRVRAALIPAPDTLRQVRDGARIPDHAAWAARGRWREAYESALALFMEGK